MQKKPKKKAKKVKKGKKEATYKKAEKPKEQKRKRSLLKHWNFFLQKLEMSMQVVHSNQN